MDGAMQIIGCRCQRHLKESEMEDYLFEVNKTRNFICKCLLCA